MKKQLEFIENENVSFYTVKLNCDDYCLMRDAITSKVYILENRLRLYVGSLDVLDEEYLSEVRQQLIDYRNLLKKI